MAPKDRSVWVPTVAVILAVAAIAVIGWLALGWLFGIGY
jgi:hypothetical protein